MPKLETIGIAPSTIGHVLRNQMLAVPINQRAYAWKETHVTDLYQDMQGAIANGEQEYFLGSIVVPQTTNGRPQVVDGQQRLATSVILLAAIRDYFVESEPE